MADAQGISVVIDEDDDSVRVDPLTGTVEEDQPGGGVIVRLDEHHSSDGDEDDGWFANLVYKLDTVGLKKIANELMEAIKADDESRKGYLDNRARGLQLLGLEIKEARSGSADSSAAVEGQSQVTNPMLLEAILKGWANAQAELLPASGPVKIRDDGEETKADDDLAEAFERDANHWFTTTASEYYPDTSHMLLWGVYFGGSGFKKVYRCPIRRRPVSESVDAKDLIVSDTTKDLRSCGRITHQIPMRPSVMKRMQIIGAYRDISLTQPTSKPDPVAAEVAAIQGVDPTHKRPEDQLYTVWETQCELDLEQFAPPQFKGKGLPLPYLVTLDKDSEELLAIRRDWNESDEDCERRRMYVKYPYVPGPGFYGTGMLNIIGNASNAMTAAWREALDAGMFASFPGGLVDKAATRQNTMDMRAGPAQFIALETGGRPIGQVAMGMPYHDVTPGLMAMIDRVTEQTKLLAGQADIPAAEGLQNVPVGTMLAQIEQATKIIAAAHKGMHTAQTQEFELIFDLFRDNPEDFWRSNRKYRHYWNEEKFLAALENCNLVPASDPNVPSHIHRVSKTIALIQLANMPLFAGRWDVAELQDRALKALREDPVGLVVQPQPQQAAPDPQMVAAQAKMMSAQAATQTAQSRIAEAQVNAQLQAAKLQTEREVAASNLQKERIIHAADQIRAAHDMGLQRAAHHVDVARTVGELAQQRHDRAMEAAQFARDGGQVEHDRAHAAHDRVLEIAQHSHEREQAQHDRALEIAQHQHDKAMDIAEHQLAVKEANKPEPKPSKG